MLGARLQDKTAADTAVLYAEGTVFRAGSLSDRLVSPTRYTVGIGEARTGCFPSPSAGLLLRQRCWTKPKRRDLWQRLQFRWYEATHHRLRPVLKLLA